MNRILILILAVVAISCSQEQPPIDYVLFSGQITNPAGDKVVVSSGDFKHEISVAEDGSFSDTLRITGDGYFRFAHGKETSSMYLIKGKHLSMTIDPTEFDETISYEGEGAAENNFMAKKYLTEEQMSGDYKELFSKDETGFMEEIDAQKGALTTLFDGFEGLSPEFIQDEEKSIQYEYLTKIQNYESYHSYFTKNDSFEVSAEFEAPLRDLDYDNEEDFVKFAAYKSLAETHYFGMVRNAPEQVDSTFEVVNAINSPSIKNSLLRSFAYDISPSNENSQAIYDGIMKLSTDEEFKANLTEKFEKVSKLVKGMPSPQFDYPDINGENVALTDLKGKYVYVDVWATWCGPCKAEIPYLKEVEHNFHGQNVQFVSISIDREKDYETWKTMVAEKELGGLQLFADKDWNSDFVTEYAIEGIPRFILIDPDGNIVNADSPRPSNPELTELLNELLSQG